MHPLLVGILNLTPDSFSDGGQYVVPQKALARAKQLFTEGAALIDVGAESTRPGATPLTADEEWQRLEPVLPALLREYPGKISLDTYHAETAARALALGDVIINDITGLSSPEMFELVASRRCRVIISHAPATHPSEIHQHELDDAAVVTRDLLAKAQALETRGVTRRNIILDPGIGFGKTMRLNKELLTFAKTVPDYAVMIGYSRKRFLGAERMELAPNLAAGKIAAAAGARYVRVHDVSGHAALVK